MILNTGRVIYHWRGGQMTRPVQGLTKIYNSALVEINFTNFHFPESSINELTLAKLDPVAKIPEYKICTVKLEKG
jgi:predicted molibdopterin-dependent oxidoreductase YjgC